MYIIGNVVVTNFLCDVQKITDIKYSIMPNEHINEEAFSPLLWSPTILNCEKMVYTEQSFRSSASGIYNSLLECVNNTFVIKLENSEKFDSIKKVASFINGFYYNRHSVLTYMISDILGVPIQEDLFYNFSDEVVTDETYDFLGVSKIYNHELLSNFYFCNKRNLRSRFIYYKSRINKDNYKLNPLNSYEYALFISDWTKDIKIETPKLMSIKEIYELIDNYRNTQNQEKPTEEKQPVEEKEETSELRNLISNLFNDDNEESDGKDDEDDIKDDDNENKESKPKEEDFIKRIEVFNLKALKKKNGFSIGDAFLLVHDVKFNSGDFDDIFKDTDVIYALMISYNSNYFSFLMCDKNANRKTFVVKPSHVISGEIKIFNCDDSSSFI